MGDRKSSAGAVFAVWAAAAAALAIRFFREHPPRPLFSSPAAIGPFDPPWAAYGAAFLAAAATTAIALLAGGGIARLLRLRRPGATTLAGLGLAFVQQVMREHGGRVVCRSREGEGTVFGLYFPAGES